MSAKKATLPPVHLVEADRVAATQRDRYREQFTAGSTWLFVPRDTADEHHGHVVEILRAPRLDVQAPTIRVQSTKGGEPFTVRPGQLEHLPRSVYADAPRTPALDLTPQLADAQGRPVWKRLLGLCHELADADQALLPLLDAPPASDPRHAEYRRLRDALPEADPSTLTALRRSAEARVAEIRASLTHRTVSLAGTVVPRGTRAEVRDQLAQDILRAAMLEAQQLRAARAGRNGRALDAPQAVVEPSLVVNTSRLDQHQRHLINRLAMAIHRRYFLSDRELRELSAADRARELHHRVIGTFLTEEQQRVGTAHVGSDTRKGSALYGALDDHMMAAHRLALEACRMMLAGHMPEALAAAQQVQAHRLAGHQAQMELERSRVQVSNGRHFHGDVLSVRDEHVYYDDQGAFLNYDGMTQYYARLVVLQHGQGYGVVIANSRDLEVLTGHVVPPSAWESLALWIEDQSERAEGRRSGRRPDDDEHLIYQAREGEGPNDVHLELRPSLGKYPEILRAFACLRAALEVDPEAQGITPGDLGEAPRPGKHAAKDPSKPPPKRGGA